jgi:hypothetical protein
MLSISRLDENAGHQDHVLTELSLAEVANGLMTSFPRRKSREYAGRQCVSRKSHEEIKTCGVALAHRALRVFVWTSCVIPEVML